MNKKWIAMVLALSLLMVWGCTQKTETPAEENGQKSEVTEQENTETDDIQGDGTVESDEKSVINIGALKGPTGMGMVQLMENDEAGTAAADYNFNMVGAPDQLVGEIVQGNVDIAAVPTNLAAILNVKTEGKIQILGVNTLGVLFVLENGDSINEISDLADKTVLSSGKGAAPEYVLDYILQKNDLTDKVNVEYAVEHSEAATKAVTGDSLVTLLPQPFVTTALLGSDDLRIALDLTKEWEKVTDGSVLPMGAIIVNREFAEQNPQAVAVFMDEYKSSVEFVNSNPKEAGVMIEKFGILPKAAVATKAIPNCNITLLTAKDAKESLEVFFNTLFEFNPKSVGGKVPEDNFYYE